MDHYSHDNGKIPNTSANQAGLELDSRPAPSSSEYLDPSYHSQQGKYEQHDPRYGGNAYQPEQQQRKILGLSIGVFWAAVVVLILVLAGGIGGGVGAGLAAQKKSCDASSLE